MKFELVATEFFIEQIRDLDRKSKDQIKEKINLISSDPFRFKRIHSKTVYTMLSECDSTEQSERLRRAANCPLPNPILSWWILNV